MPILLRLGWTQVQYVNSDHGEAVRYQYRLRMSTQIQLITYDTLHADLQNRNCETSRNPKSFSSRNCSIWPLCPAIEMISFDGSYNSFEKLLHVGNCLSIATANMYHPPTLWAVTFEHFLSAIKEWGYVWQPNYTVISPHTKLNIYSLNCRDESPITIL